MHEDWISQMTAENPQWVKQCRTEYLRSQISRLAEMGIRGFGVLDKYIQPQIRVYEAEIRRWERKTGDNRGQIAESDIEAAKRADWEGIEPASHYSGPNRRKMICPFHEEKTASMVLYSGNGYHCFGCGAHGDTIDYVMKRDNLNFQEAVKYLIN